MRDVAVVGVGMTKFTKWLDRSLKSLAEEACQQALGDAGIDAKEVQVAYVGNAVAGIMSGQECIRGQVVLQRTGITGIPIINLENACASSSTAFQQAWLSVASGMFDVALALGVEKLYDEDKTKSFRAVGEATVDVEAIPELAARAGTGAGNGKTRSFFMDIYGMIIRDYMARSGARKEHFAQIAVKNHHHGFLNPHAQYQVELTVEEVLQSPLVVEPLTVLMCSPIGDGAAATVLCSAEYARRSGGKPVWVAGLALTSANAESEGIGTSNCAARRAASAAYEMARLGPEDIDVAEVHDAVSAAEMIAYEDLGFCRPGEASRLVEEGATTLGGRLPVNTSGGLGSKGHPVGATGTAMVTEVVWQLRGEAGQRQVAGAKVGLCHNGGGFVGNDAAAFCVTILKC